MTYRRIKQENCRHSNEIATPVHQQPTTILRFCNDGNIYDDTMQLKECVIPIKERCQASFVFVSPNKCQLVVSVTAVTICFDAKLMPAWCAASASAGWDLNVSGKKKCKLYNAPSASACCPRCEAKWRWPQLYRR